MTHPDNMHTVNDSSEFTALAQYNSIHHTTDQPSIPIGSLVAFSCHQGWPNPAGGYDIMTIDTGVVTKVTENGRYCVELDMPRDALTHMMISRNLIEPITEDEREALIAAMPSIKRILRRR